MDKRTLLILVVALFEFYSVSAQKIKAVKEKDPVSAKILKQVNKVNDDGSYTFGYESDDGSFKVETRDKNGLVRGKYGFVDPNGDLKTIEYTAGEKSPKGGSTFKERVDQNTAAQTASKNVKDDESSTETSAEVSDAFNSFGAQPQQQFQQRQLQNPRLIQQIQQPQGAYYQQQNQEGERPRYVATSRFPAPEFGGFSPLTRQGQGAGRQFFSPQQQQLDGQYQEFEDPRFQQFEDPRFPGTQYPGPGPQGPTGLPSRGPTIAPGGRFGAGRQIIGVRPGGAPTPGQYVPSVELEGFSEDADQDGYVDEYPGQGKTAQAAEKTAAVKAPGTSQIGQFRPQGVLAGQPGVFGGFPGNPYQSQVQGGQDISQYQGAQGLQGVQGPYQGVQGPYQPQLHPQFLGQQQFEGHPGGHGGHPGVQFPGAQYPGAQYPGAQFPGGQQYASQYPIQQQAQLPQYQQGQGAQQQYPAQQAQYPQQVYPQGAQQGSQEYFEQPGGSQQHLGQQSFIPQHQQQFQGQIPQQLPQHQGFPGQGGFPQFQGHPGFPGQQPYSQGGIQTQGFPYDFSPFGGHPGVFPGGPGGPGGPGQYQGGQIPQQYLIPHSPNGGDPRGQAIRVNSSSKESDESSKTK